MIGYLIYDKKGASINKWFCDRLIEEAGKKGHILELKILEDTDFTKEKLPQFAIMRAISPSVSSWLQEQNVRVFNNATTSKIANNKYLTFKLSRDLGIDTMDTYILEDEYKIPDGLFYPFVVKSLSGHGGQEVYMVNSLEEYRQVFSILKGSGICQALCSDVGKDVRIYTIAGELLLGVLRYSDKDFRSNFSLGGNATLFTPTEDMLKAVDKIYSALQYDFVGIDFIYHNGRWVLNEIEDVVGTRMIYTLTSIDAAKEYIEYIEKRLICE